MSYSRHGLYAQSSGITADLLKHKAVRLRTWGTDIDFRHCLKNDLTINPFKSITHNGTYVLPPVSLTEQIPGIDAPPYEAVKHHITECLQAARENNVTGRVSILIPVSTHYDSHWQLARIYMKNQKITSGLLWDSFPGDNKQKRTEEAFVNLQIACMEAAQQDKKIPFRIQSEGIQRDGFSCMDHVIRQIYLAMKKDNAITQAKTTTELRLAVIKHIAKQHDALKSMADSLVVLPNNTIGTEPTFELSLCYGQISKAERKELKALFKSCPDYLANFERYYLHALNYETSSAKKATYYAIERLCKRVEIDQANNAALENATKDDVKMDEQPAQRMTP